MKRTIVLLLSTFMWLFTIAQDATVDNSNQFSAGVADEVTFLPPPDMVTKILDVSGLSANFEVRQGKVRNVEASISRKKRLIIYNPEFISDINAISQNKWAAVALFAHEIGHHLNGHTLSRSGSKPHLELEADEFAGFILHKLGATLQESQDVMNYIASVTASKTHPARMDRMEAIERGWEKAGVN